MHNSYQSASDLQVGKKHYRYYSLPKAIAHIGDETLARLPFSLKILMENLLRHEDGRTVHAEDVTAFSEWIKQGHNAKEIAYRPSRVLMQDFTGVPAVADLAAMRDSLVSMGHDAQKINPLNQVDLVIDHSVMVDFFASDDAFQKNVEREFERNQERYEFLRWGQKAFDNFRVVPPGTGICHQVNLEYLAPVVGLRNGGEMTTIFPDTVVGTDSHTTMINGLGVLGWGVGGIEAEAAMLGQPISMLIPEVVGFELSGKLPEGATATDLVLRVVEMLRAQGVVGKFVEFYGDGLDELSLADRATIANMAPEYGATCGIFPIDRETIHYMRLSGRDDHQVELVEAYAKAQGMWRDATTPTPVFTTSLSLALSSVVPALAGPKRPQDRVVLTEATAAFQSTLNGASPKTTSVKGEDYSLSDGHVVLAAITSCTNTSNPDVLIAAGLVARKARALGLERKPWVKTSFAPGSQVVSDYMEAAGLQQDLNHLGFHLVGYGCTSCIGNSGPLPEPISAAIDEAGLDVCAVLSGNRNFEGRVNPQTKANYLASPPLVVAYALAGSLLVDITKEPLGHDAQGNLVYLKDVWPSNAEIAEIREATVLPEVFRERYADVFTGPKEWQELPTTDSQTFDWDAGSTYVQMPPFFEGLQAEPEATPVLENLRPLLLLGDSITTDHISPAGSFKPETPAGSFLVEHQVRPKDFNSYGSRRGNHQVMVRGTFANIRIRNEAAPGTEGGFATHHPSGEVASVFDVAMRYQQEGVGLVVIGGKEYGTGSSRDWAAKGTRLLGIRAVIAESFERIHRSNLIGMGVLALQFQNGDTRHSLGLDGSEQITLSGLEEDITPRQNVTMHITRANGETLSTTLLCRIDTVDEVDYYRHGGILQYVLRQML